MTSGTVSFVATGESLFFCLCVCFSHWLFVEVFVESQSIKAEM